MKVHNYDSATGIYLGENEAALDPLELQINGREIYLLPAHATFEAPPAEEEGKKVVMQDGKWAQVDIPKPEPIPEPVVVPEPAPPSEEMLAAQEAETLIQAKIRELAITALKSEGKLDETGKVAVAVKDTEVKNDSLVKDGVG